MRPLYRNGRERHGSPTVAVCYAPGGTYPMPIKALLPLPLLVAVAASCGTHAGASPSEFDVIGGPGRQDGRFVTPRGVSTAGDRLFVVDRSGRVQEFDRRGRFRRTFEVQPRATRGFPLGVLAEPDGGFTLVDTHQSRVRRFDAGGAEVLAFGGLGEEPGRFMFPQRAVRDDGGELYVSEYGDGPANRVQVFDARGRLRRTIGGVGGDSPGLTRAIGLALLGRELYVADVSDRILVFGTDGAFHREFGTTGGGTGELRYPYGLCTRGGLLYVCEYGNHRIQRFTPDGESRGAFGRVGRGAGELSGPSDVATGEDGRLYVADTGNHRVVVIDPDRVPWSEAAP